MFFVGKPYFATTNSPILYGTIEEHADLSIALVDFAQPVNITLRQTLKVKYYGIMRTQTRVVDTVYGQVVSVQGTKFFLRIEISDMIDFRSYIIITENVFGFSNYSIKIEPAGEFTFYYT